MKQFLSLVALAATLSVPSMLYAQTGASVTIPTSYVSLYVDSSFTGTTVSGPGATYRKLQDAMDQAAYQARSVEQNGTPKTANNVRIFVKKGNDYREQLDLSDYATVKAVKTITLEAFDPNNKPIFYGSDYWGVGSFGQSASLLNGKQVHYHSCSTPVGVREDIWATSTDPTISVFNIPPVVRRQEVMILNNAPMKRVLTYGEMVPGTFYVNETVGPPSSGYSNYFFIPPTGTNMSTATAEVGSRPIILKVMNRQNVILKDLNFQTAADYFYGGVRIEGCTNVLVQNCMMKFNGGKGMVLDRDTNVTVRGCTFDSNGIGGLAGGSAYNMLIQNVSSNNNNWRGNQGGLGGWDSAGIKFYKMHFSKFDTVTTNNSQGKAPGLWLDTDIKDVIVSNLTAKFNDMGLFYEAAQGPCSVINGSNLSNNATAGVYVASANKLTLDGCTIGNNGYSTANVGKSQVLFFGNSSGRTYQDFTLGSSAPIEYAYGETYDFKNNKIFWTTDTTFKALYSANGDVFNYQKFISTLTATRNQYWHADPNTPWVFQRYDGTYTNGVFSNWKLDLASRKPAGTAVEVGSAYLNINTPLP
jgi:parallel beta-helix repeat protein